MSITQVGGTLQDEDFTRVYRFAASHRLHAASLSEARKCRALRKVQSIPTVMATIMSCIVSVAGEPDSKTGRIVDIGALDRYVQERVLSIYDHSDLNADVPDFKACRQQRIWRSTATGGCVRLAVRESPSLDRVLIQETGRNSVELRKAN